MTASNVQPMIGRPLGDRDIEVVTMNLKA